MSKVRKHIFGAKDNISVYCHPSSLGVLGLIKKGEWMGVVDDVADYFLIITPRFFGWVLKSECESLEAKPLTVSTSKEYPQYFVG